MSRPLSLSTEQAAQALSAVMALHKHVVITTSTDDGFSTERVCTHCHDSDGVRRRYPCETVRAVNPHA